MDQIHSRQDGPDNGRKKVLDCRDPELEFCDNPLVLAKESENLDIGGSPEDEIVTPEEPESSSQISVEKSTEMTELLTNSVSPNVLRRSQRIRKLPGHLKDYELK